jgi:hypothetical protein
VSIGSIAYPPPKVITTDEHKGEKQIEVFFHLISLSSGHTPAQAREKAAKIGAPFSMRSGCHCTTQTERFWCVSHNRLHHAVLAVATRRADRPAF